MAACFIPLLDYQDMAALFFIFAVAILQSAALRSAPGDADMSCVTGANAKSYPSDWRVLLDSYNYENLLEGPSAVWQRADVDGQGQGWDQYSESCRRKLRICNVAPEDNQNWLFTQHIDNGEAEEIIVEVSFDEHHECLNHDNCVMNNPLNIYAYETNVTNGTTLQVTNISNYIQIGAFENMHRTFKEVIRFSPSRDYSGFHLGIEDTETCSIIKRIRVYYKVCPSRTEGLTTYPETPRKTASEPVVVQPTCFENSEVVSSLLCWSNGTFTVENSSQPACACSPGYVFESNGEKCHCIGLGPAVFSGRTPPTANTTTATIYWNTFGKDLGFPLKYSVYLKVHSEDTYTEWREVSSEYSPGGERSTTLYELAPNVTYSVAIITSYNEPMPESFNESSAAKYRNRIARSHFTTSISAFNSSQNSPTHKENGYLSTISVLVVLVITLGGLALAGSVFIIWKWRRHKTKRSTTPQADPESQLNTTVSTNSQYNSDDEHYSTPLSSMRDLQNAGRADTPPPPRKSALLPGELTHFNSS